MPVGRHRHAINVRADGLASVLGPLAGDPAVQAALLVDVDSGMTLDACGPRSGGTGVDQEQLGAAHGELMRLALGPASRTERAGGPAAGDCEIVVNLGGERHLVVRRVPDPFGDRLALSVVVDGPPRAVRRTRRRLREVSAAALTAGPTVSLRPVEGSWVPGVDGDRPAPPGRARPTPAGPPEPTTPPSGPGPVGGSALAALDAPVVPWARPVPALGPMRVTVRPAPVAAGSAARDPATSEPRPAPPSALPPAQRADGD